MGTGSIDQWRYIRDGSGKHPISSAATFSDLGTIGADSSAMFMNLMPVIAIVLASTWLGEKINQFHIIGGAMVISGVILTQIKRKPRLEAPLPQQN